MREGKGRYDLLPVHAIKRLAQLYERGAQKYGDRNWELGQPLASYADSMLRHAFQAAAGDTDEDHWAAVAWNAFAVMDHQERIARGELDESLDDLPGGQEFEDGGLTDEWKINLSRSGIWTSAADPTAAPLVGSPDDIFATMAQQHLDKILAPSVLESLANRPPSQDDVVVFHYGPRQAPTHIEVNVQASESAEGIAEALRARIATAEAHVTGDDVVMAAVQAQADAVIADSDVRLLPVLIDCEGDEWAPGPNGSYFLATCRGCPTTQDQWTQNTRSEIELHYGPVTEKP